MTLFEHTKIIKRWIRSCDTSEQLDLVADIIKEFVVNRFIGSAETWEINQAANELLTEIMNRRIIVAANLNPNSIS